MTNIIEYFDEGPEDSPENTTPIVDVPYDRRPNLEELGIIEIERGICEDTFDNRAILRRSMLKWSPVFDDQTGAATNLIIARSIEQDKERALISINNKRQLLSDPGNVNSDFLTGLDLLLDDDAQKIAPPWVLGATRNWLKEQEEGGPKSAKRAPLGLPGRCRLTKTDGTRCQLWNSGRIKDDGLCRIHLGSTRRTANNVEIARQKISQASSYAVDVLEELMETAVSEPVKLKAATEILDRAGVRGGMELNVDIKTTDRSPAEILAERLARLEAVAAERTTQLTADGVQVTEVYAITDVTPKPEDGLDPDARNE
ncbi:MAG: hypothetical protein LW628_09215 [Fimbriimonadaceae bacterium]|jgi:hypothetical protein|nr:hypothetical protein [Fimbriimonadaceae bacterium]